MRRALLGFGRAVFPAVVLAVSLAGCGDPLREVPRLDEVPVAEEAGQAEIMASGSSEALPEVDVPEAPEAGTPNRGFLGFLRRQADAAKAQEAEASTPAPKEATGDSVQTTDVSAPDNVAAPVVDENAAPVMATVSEIGPEIGPEVGPEIGPESSMASQTSAPQAAQPRQRRGLFGMLRGRGKTEPAPESANAAPEATDAGEDAVIELAAAEVERPDPAPETAVEEQPARRGLFGGGRAARGAEEAAPPPLPDNAPDAQVVSLGTRLPYGQIARVCNVRPAQLGAKTQSYPERGKGYDLYDSAPGSTAARTFYMTGFKDGCARQFTAALVIFGSVETWEQIHYGAAAKVQPMSNTDHAYERVKSRVCRVSKGKPCGSRLRAMSRDTVFVSVYERFDSNPRWKNILLHKGTVAAVDMKQ